MDIKIQADQTSQRCSANTYIFVLKVHNICLLGFGGGGAQTPSSSFYTPPLPSCPYRPINKFYFKESQTKGLWPTHLRRNNWNADSVFSIVHARAFGYHHELPDCQQINQSVYSICCHSNIPLALELISYPNYTSVIRSDIFAFDWCNLVCSSFFQHLNVKVIY